MANDLRFTDLLVNRMLDAAFSTATQNHDLLHSGLLNIYAATSTEPHTGGIPDGEPGVAGITHGTLLAQLVFHATAPVTAAAAVSGQTYNSIIAGGSGEEITADASADAEGTACYFVIYDDDTPDVAQIMGTVGTSGCDLTIDSATIAAGATVSCSELQLRLGKGWATA